MDRIKNQINEGTYYSVIFVPSSERYKLNWKYRALAPLGIDYGSKTKPKAPWKPIFAKEKLDAVRRADGVLQEALSLCAKARKLSADQRENILTKAAQLFEKGVDPVAAMKLGGKSLASATAIHTKILLTHRQGFTESRINGNKWSKRVQRQWEIFFEEHQDALDRGDETLLQKALVEFTNRGTVTTAISNEVHRWMDSPKTNRKAENTLQKYLSKLSTFLRYVSHQVEHYVLTPTLVEEIFSEEGRLSELKLPSGLEGEQANQKLTPAQARHLISTLLVKHPESTIFYVMKLFAGQRTKNLMDYDWSFIDWKDQKVSIPKSYTKNKRGDVEFGFNEIPHFADWILFAFNRAGNPETGKMVNQSQPIMTGRVTKIMNQDPDLYTFGDGQQISGAKHVRNILRNTFISYGIEQMGRSVTSRIVEDSQNLNSYLANTQAGAGNNAKEFFEISPSSLDLWDKLNVPPF